MVKSGVACLAMNDQNSSKTSMVSLSGVEALHHVMLNTKQVGHTHPASYRCISRHVLTNDMLMQCCHISICMYHVRLLVMTALELKPESMQCVSPRFWNE